MNIEKRHGYCALCISRCGCVATLVDGRMTRVDPDRAHPTGQALCLKARSAPEQVYHPQRLLFPQRRTRPKGDPDPGWERLGWDEALDLLASKIASAAERHGPRGVAWAVATPSGTALADSFGWIHRLARAQGSPNMVFATENCNWHKDFAPVADFGAGIGMPDYEHTGCIVLWGFNPGVSWLAQASAIKAAKQRGARLIVIDPRRSGLAASADVWLRPRPGSDGALALGLIHHRLQGQNFDREFVAQWSDAPCLLRVGSDSLLTEADLVAGGDRSRPLAWDQTLGTVHVLAARASNAAPGLRLALSGRFTIATLAGPVECEPVLHRLATLAAEWTPQRVEAVCGIPPDALESAARLIATQGPLSWFTWTGTAQHDNASHTGRALRAWYALSGSLDAKGGNVWFERPALADISGAEFVTPATRSETLGLAERPLGPPARGWITTRDLFRAVVERQPYPVSCLVAFGGNFMQSKPATRLNDDALRALDFFAVAEQFETPSARMADLLLPVGSAWEREGLQGGFMVGAAAEAHLQLRPALAPAQGESRSDRWIVFELARRLGLGDAFFGLDPELALDHILAPSGVDAKTLRAAPQGMRLALVTRYRKYRQSGFATGDGRLHFFDAALAARGLPPLPLYQPPQRQASAEFPLLLTTAKWPQFCHSQHRQLPSLRRSMPDPLLEIHPDTAAAAGIAAGDWVDLVTPQARVPARARLDAHLAAEVVCAQYGWWQYADHAGDSNRLFDGERFDAISGSNSLRHAPCRIERSKRMRPAGADAANALDPAAAAAREQGSERPGAATGRAADLPPPG
ncbi:molybdopterin-dependent oxidoreductase [Paludibacterium yongneupense]|uniref:molybdopterin-dependent oxidoreductase n=1 Tax=Paludibacterium yongneupense TaxID=400061 RepID=UPI00040A9B50|nr:molybdopterin-dependent oxidoreductase [Paludibacterium yongneupense]